MVKFGKKMLRLQHDPWNEHYLDYKRLKKLLNKKFKMEMMIDNKAGGDGGDDVPKDNDTTDIPVVDEYNNTLLTPSLLSSDKEYDTIESQSESNQNKSPPTLPPPPSITRITHDTNVTTPPSPAKASTTAIANNQSYYQNDIMIQAQFRQSLDREIERVVLFFLHQQGELASKLSHLASQRRQQSLLGAVPNLTHKPLLRPTVRFRNTIACSLEQWDKWRHLRSIEFWTEFDLDRFQTDP